MFSTLLRTFQSVIFPPLCLHCKETLSLPEYPLCKSCVGLLELINPEERCPLCFSGNFCANTHLCSECKKRPPLLNGIAAAFDYVGPASTLVRKIKYADQPYLTKGCAAFLSAQFLRLNWPMPDLIAPVPIAFTHLITRGYNQSQLLAQELGSLLDIQVVDLLERHSGDYSQAGLSRAQRLELKGHRIQLRTIKSNVEDKCILLIDDVLTSGSTMRKCAEALTAVFPSKIYGLAVCKAM